MFYNQFKHVYQFKIVLKETKPPTWRRIQVPDNYSIEDLHATIQDVMDWTVCAGTSYEFRIAELSTGLVETIGCSSYGYARYAGIDEPSYRIADCFYLHRAKASYTCREESRWEFSIELEEIPEAEKLCKRITAFWKKTLILLFYCGLRQSSSSGRFAGKIAKTHFPELMLLIKY